MEYVFVHFREFRAVFVDGNEAGSTNESIRVNQGLHTFSLAGPADFTPREYTAMIANTTEARPLGVFFA